MKQTRLTRWLSGLLCLFLLAGPMSSLLVLTTLAADTSGKALTSNANAQLRLVLTWDDGSTGVRSAGSTVTAKITVAGPGNGEAVKVTLSTIDLSARSDDDKTSVGNEYKQVRQEFTLYDTGGSDASATMTVDVYNQKRYNGNTRTDSYYPAVKVGTTAYRRQFGIQIESHSDNAYVDGTRTLRAYVRHPSSSWELTTTENMRLSFYTKSGAVDSFAQVLRGYGYSYTGSASVYTNKSPTFYNESSNPSSYWDSENKRWKLEKNDDKDEGYWLFKSPYEYLKSQNQTKLLMENTSGWYIYMAGTFTMRKHNGGDLHNDSMRYWIQRNDPDDIDQWDGTHPVDGNGSGSIDSGSIGTGSSGDKQKWPRSSNTDGRRTTVSRNGFDRWLVVWHYEERLEPYLHCDNDEGLAGTYKTVSDVTLSQILLRDTGEDNATGPKVQEIYTSQSAAWNGENELYLMVRFSDPIQLLSYDYDLSDLVVRAQAYDYQYNSRADEVICNNRVGETISFHYVDGNYTDTFIFKATLSDANRGVLYGSRLRIVDFQYNNGINSTDITYLADLFLNTQNSNNSVSLSIEHLKTNGDYFIDCAIDTRLPEITMSESFPTEPVQSFKPTLTISNTRASTVKVSYIYSEKRNASEVQGAWQTPMMIHDIQYFNEPYHTKVNAYPDTPTGLDGRYYLHVKAISDAGIVNIKTFTLGSNSTQDKTLLLDNTPPVIEHLIATGDGQAHSRYQSSHKITLKITDPQRTTPIEYGTVTDVWYTVRNANGVVQGSERVHVYDRSAEKNPMTYDKATGLFTMTLSSSDFGMAANTYGAYTVSFTARDGAGNETPTDAAYTLPQELMFDTRTGFALTYDWGYGEYLNDYPESVIPAEYTLGGCEILYSNWKGDHLRIEVSDADAAGSQDKYELLTIRHNGIEVYEKGKGEDGKGWLIPGGRYNNEAYGFVENDDLGITIHTHNGGFPFTLAFKKGATGRYDMVFLKNGEQQSEVLSFYLTPEEAATPGYSTLYDPERLLVNRVWQLTTGTYYSGSRTSGTPYDGGEGAPPIFSSYEKAFEYARFMEAQDIELVTLTGTEGENIAAMLNNPSVKGYQKANGETVTAAAGQTWLRYKSRLWTPADKSTSSLWVYYFYSENTLTTIDVESLDDIASASPNLAEAVEDNAADIAGSPEEGYTWTYLTANAYNAYTDEYKQPTYPSSAIFAHDIIMQADFGREMTFVGDSAIYDSFVEAYVGTTEMILPLVANYTFDLGPHDAVQYRAAGTENWITVTDGQTLRSFETAGVYEIKELNDGYRTYFIYVDLSAPSLVFDYVVPGQEQPSEEPDVFNGQFNGQVIQAKEITLRHMVTEQRPVEGEPPEVDPYSYIYLSRSDFGGMSEQVAYFYTLSDLASESGIEIPDGTYIVYVYDRLGNHYSLTVHTNRSPLMEVEPEVKHNTSVTFTFNRQRSQIASFSITRTGNNTREVDTVYEQTKVYTKSGTYDLYIEDIFGNTETRTVTLERDPPELTYYYKSGAGGYSLLRPIGADETVPQATATVQQHAKDVYVISSSVDMRIAFSAYASYRYTLTPETTPHTVMDTTSYRFLDIPVGDTRWTLTVYYANDPDAKVTVTCINDNTPPVVTADCTVPTYDFGETAGFDHILPEKTGETVTYRAASGEVANAESVTFRWDDGAEGSGVEIVTYTVDGGETHHIDPKTQSELTVTKAGRYEFTVVDLLGNTTSFAFTVTDELDFDITLADGTEVTYPADPFDAITGTGAEATFTETAYTGQAFTVTLREALSLTLARERDGVTTVSRIGYRDGVLTVDLLEGTLYRTVKTLTLTSETASGELTDPGFAILYRHEGAHLSLEFPFEPADRELWHLRLCEPAGSIPTVIRLERSNRLPALTPVKAESHTRVEANDKTFTGINEPFTLEGDMSDITSVIAYRSVRHTTDFSEVSPQNTYDMLTSGLVVPVEEEGYFKVVVTNKYGNKQAFLLRVSFGADIDVVLSYDDLEAREHILKDPGNYEFFTNDSVVIRVWNTDARLTVTRNGAAYSPPTRTGNGCIELTFGEKGSYTVQAKDDFGNDFTIHLSIEAPKTLPYGDFLTDFNPDALLREQHYTNAPVSLDAAALKAADIAYVAYRTEDTEVWTTLYDILSQDTVSVPFERCLGGRNGVYTVRFADRYGNPCETTVHISSRAELFLSRNTKNSAGNMDIRIEAAVTDGIWSNYIVRLRNEAAAYRLTVDGVEASFNTKGEYLCELPLQLGDNAEETHRITYLDSYGNRYEFTVHLLRRIPAVTTVSEGEEIVRDRTVYVKGSFGFEWSDETITALYSLGDTRDLAYQKGERLTTDGTYTFTFTDIAGNIETRRICRDTTVSYTLVHGSTAVASGITVTGSLRVQEDSEPLIFTEVLRNGEPYTPDGRTFDEHGSYTVTITDEVGNTETVRFDIYNDPMKSFTYITKGEYALYQVWYYTDGIRQPANGILLNEEGYQEFTFFDDGQYDVDLLHIPSNTYVTYTVEIDNRAPEVTLVGTIVDGVTRETVTLEGLADGDTVEIWLDGELTETRRVSSLSEPPAFRDAGDYRIVIRDLAGNETVHEFVREFTTNTASNILICLALVGSAAGCVLILHNRGRIRIK